MTLKLVLGGLLLCLASCSTTEPLNPTLTSKFALSVATSPGAFR